MEGSWLDGSARFVLTALFIVVSCTFGRRTRCSAEGAFPVPDPTDCDLLGCGGPYECYGNGWPNYLPRVRGGPYSIPALSTFSVSGTGNGGGAAGQIECLLGTANNYLPWLTEDGRLTVSPGRHALDLSHLRLTDAGLQVLVESLGLAVPLEGVQHLSLAHNALLHVPVPTLNSMPNLRLLSLRANTFTELSADSIVYSKLPSLPRLRVLDLQNCSLRALPDDFFRGIPNLQYLFLAGNTFRMLPMALFLPLRALLHLDLSNMDTSRQGEERIENPFMKLIAGLDLHQSVFAPLGNLVFLDLSNTRLEFHAFIALRSIQRRVRYVSYCNIGLPAIVDYLFVARSIEMLDISYNVGVAQSLHKASFQLLRNSLEVLYFKDSMVQQLAWLAPLGKLRVLNLRGNIIRELRRDSFTNLTRLERLDLSYNYISAWNQQILTNTGALRSVNLRNNSIVILTTDMLYDFSRLQNMGLGGNTIQCSCNYLKFLRNIMHNQSDTPPGAYAISAEPLFADKYNGGSGPLVSLQHVQLFDYDESEYFCMNFTSNQKLDPMELSDCVLSDEELIDIDLPAETAGSASDGDTLVYILVSIAATFVVVTAIGLFYYWFHIKYFFTILKNSTILSFFNDNEKLYLDRNGLLKDSDYHYDVFVSYSNEDRKWVLDHLLPNMEGVSQVNLCLHERDFEVGYSILENIISCMDRSRCLMLIVSESFLLSHWCQFEMHLAQHRLLETRREELILVLLQDIPRRKCPKTLSYLLKTKTYIKWPTGSVHEQALFWKRLHKALSTSKC
ncbi:toll-like receptor 13 isoform X1 [Anopheles albimanus]|uniref:TIR domain-containing protein n=1 Tax=Anopheles albimanus TaxID=7167 RepID=A0A182FGA8_ANOAL|nr:toll-like receptor 13 isoform X1 [Anopheles albimanus]